MKILRAADHKVMPWKNGLGSTTEIAISPAHADTGDFDWRVSMAQVTTNGPFSSFPGIDRTLLVLDGAGIVLTVADHAPARLDRTSIHSFPGDQSTSSALIAGPITDLNIMTRRDCMQHRVQRIKVMSPQHFQTSSYMMMFVEHGTAAIKSDACTDELHLHDALLIDHTTTISMESAAPADVVVIEWQRR